MRFSRLGGSQRLCPAGCFLFYWLLTLASFLLRDHDSVIQVKHFKTCFHNDVLQILAYVSQMLTNRGIVPFAVREDGLNGSEPRADLMRMTLQMK